MVDSRKGGRTVVKSRYSLTPFATAATAKIFFQQARKTGAFLGGHIALRIAGAINQATEFQIGSVLIKGCIRGFLA
jgi:hypothetical protein